MADPTTDKTTYALALGIIWIAKEAVSFLIRKKRNGSASGDLRPEEWDLRIGKIVRDELERWERQNKER